MSLYGAVLSPQLVPSYIQRLNKEKIMRGKSFASLNMQQGAAVEKAGKSYVEFSMHSTDAKGAAK
jgi:hypothetical protein